MEIITRKEAIAQGLKRYFTGKPCKHGHVSERTINRNCVECALEMTRKWREKNKDYGREYRSKNERKIKDYYNKNKSRILKANKEYRVKNEEKVKAAKLKYLEANRDAKRKYDKVNKERFFARRREWAKSNPFSVFTRKTLYRLEVRSSGSKYEDILSYTQDDFKLHIESLWLEGMSWDNRSEWHIDHIKPIKAFLDEGVTDPAIINALSNLQPLWAKDNLSKGAKYND